MAPFLTLSTTEVVPNQSLAIIGRGFTGGGQAGIETMSIGGEMVTPSKINGGATINIDSGGNWGASLVIPINTITTTAGTYRLRVTDSEGRQGVANLEIPRRTLTLGPSQSRRGSTITAAGTGYPAISTVVIIYTVSGVQRTVSTNKVNSAGEFAATFSVPISAPIPSVNTVVAELTFGTTTVSSSTVHTVPPASVALDLTEGPPGTNLALTGVGFPGFTSLPSLFIGGVDVVPIPNPATSFEGEFTARVLVPGIAAGAAEVFTTVGSVSATTVFTVTRSPSLPDYPLSTSSPVISVSPAEGEPGSLVTITGTGFPGFTSVREITIGGVNHTPAPNPSTDPFGAFTATILIAAFNPDVYLVSVTVGDTTARTFFTVTETPIAVVVPAPTIP